MRLSIRRFWFQLLRFHIQLAAVLRFNDGHIRSSLKRNSVRGNRGQQPVNPCVDPGCCGSQNFRDGDEVSAMRRHIRSMARDARLLTRIADTRGSHAPRRGRRGYLPAMRLLHFSLFIALAPVVYARAAHLHHSQGRVAAPDRR